MAITGSELLNITLLKLDKFYSKYLDNTKWNRLFKMALFNLSERKYLGFTSQKELDDLRFAIKADIVFTVKNSQISITPLIISNITTAGALLRFTTLTPHNLDIGDSVTVSGAQGITTIPPVNSTFSVLSVVSPTVFDVIITFVTGLYVPNSGTLVTPYLMTDYLHLLTVKCKTKELLNEVQVIQAISRTPCIVVFNRPTNIATGDQIAIEGHPNTSINGVFWYKKINVSKGRLYLDEHLTLPATCTNSSVEGGTVSRIYYNYAEPLYSDRKISQFEAVSFDAPKVQTSDGVLKFLPTTSQISIDYYAKPVQMVDVSDITVDLTNIYPEKFLYRLIDEAILIYSLPSRDVLLDQLTEKEIVS